MNEHILSELRLIREQMRSDQEATMLGLATERDATRQSFEAVERSFDEIRQSFKGIRGSLETVELTLGAHVQKADRRFGHLLDIMEGMARQGDSLEDQVQEFRREIKAIKGRLDRLEEGAA